PSGSTPTSGAVPNPVETCGDGTVCAPPQAAPGARLATCTNQPLGPVVSSCQVATAVPLRPTSTLRADSSRPAATAPIASAGCQTSATVLRRAHSASSPVTRPLQSPKAPPERRSANATTTSPLTGSMATSESLTFAPVLF